MTVWRNAVTELLALVMTADPRDEPDLIKHLSGILDVLPGDEGARLGITQRRPLVASFIENGALESAVLSLIGSRCGYLLTQSQEGLASAVVTVDGAGYEPGFFSISPVFALIGAFCETLLTFDQEQAPLDIDVVKFIRH